MSGSAMNTGGRRKKGMVLTSRVSITQRLAMSISLLVGGGEGLPFCHNFFLSFSSLHLPNNFYLDPCSFLAFVLPIPFPVSLGKRRNEWVAVWLPVFWLRSNHHIKKKFGSFLWSKKNRSHYISGTAFSS